MKILLILLFFINSHQRVFAKNDDQLWVMLLARGALYQKLLGYFEYQPRLKYDSSQTQAIMHRNAFGWQLENDHSLWIGHAYLETRVPRIFSEYRTYLEWRQSSKHALFKSLQQARLEQRNFSDQGTISHRLRYKFKLIRPIIEEHAIYYVFQNEIFYNVNSISQSNRSGFEQNRFYFGVGKEFTSQHHLEVALTRTLRFIKNDTNELMNFFVLKYMFYF